MNLPTKPLLNAEFAARGVPGVVKWDVIPVTAGDILRVVFEGVRSPWRQGVFLFTNGLLGAADTTAAKFVLWADTAPEVGEITVQETDGPLHLYNVWDSGRRLGMESQALSSGMKIENVTGGRRYGCNDLGFDTAFDKLVLRLQLLPKGRAV